MSDLEEGEVPPPPDGAGPPASDAAAAATTTLTRADGSGGGGGGSNQDNAAAAAAAARAALKRRRADEVEELTAAAAAAARRAGFEDVRDDFAGSCGRLRGGILALDSLLRRIKRHKHDSVSQYPEAAAASRRLADGVKAVLVLCSSAGRGESGDEREPAHALMRAAVTRRHAVFAPAAAAELEALVRASASFRYLFDGRGTDGRVPAAPPPAAAAPAAAAGTLPALPPPSPPPGTRGGGGAGAGEVARLLAARRLVLVLDLDHTLVSSARFGEVAPETERRLQAMLADQVGAPGQELFRLPRVGMWTKLRPGARALLAAAAQRYELWIHTAATARYAAAVAEVLGAGYFGGRIIAQADAAGGGGEGAQAALSKRLAEGLEGREPVAVILDDSSAVWPHDRRNLLVAERYVYLPTAHARAAGAGSLLEMGRDEDANDNMLAAAARVLAQLHAEVFARLAARAPPSEWDARAALRALRRRVLAGLVLAFSRVAPIGADARAHPLWRLCEQFGARAAEAVGDGVTHVVTTHGGTEKAVWARQRGAFVVGPEWLECSCILWRRADEARFPPPA